MVDMKDIVYPEREERDWTFVSNTLWQNLRDHPVRRYGFDSTTVSECDQRIRNFMAVDYTQKREDNKITLEYTSMESSVWFLLRTEQESVNRVEGGECQRLEKGVYLIEAKEDQVTIDLAPLEE